MQLHKTLLLVGGGHAHALFLRQWHKQPVPGVNVVVIDPHKMVPYTGMLPGFVAGHYEAADLYIDLQQLTSAAGGTLVTDSVAHIDPEQKIAKTASGQVYQYDVLSVMLGYTLRLTYLDLASTRWGSSRYMTLLNNGRCLLVVGLQICSLPT